MIDSTVILCLREKTGFDANMLVVVICRRRGNIYQILAKYEPYSPPGGETVVGGNGGGVGGAGVLGGGGDIPPLPV